MVIEHNPDVVKSADHIIDLGPEGGEEGGTVVATGTPEEIAINDRSHTGRFLKRILDIPVGRDRPDAEKTIGSRTAGGR